MGTLFFYYLFCSCLEETAELEESRRGGSPKGIFCVGLFLRARALDLDLNLDDVAIGGSVWRRRGSGSKATRENPFEQSQEGRYCGRVCKKRALGKSS